MEKGGIAVMQSGGAREKRESGYRLRGAGRSVLRGLAFPRVPGPEAFLVLYVRSGAGKFLRNGTEVAVAPGDLLLLRFGIPNFLRARGGPLSCTALLIEGDPVGVPLLSHVGRGSEAERRLEELAESAGRPKGAPPAPDALMEALRAGAASGEKPYRGNLGQLKAIMDRRYAEHLRVGRLAAELHLNKFRLARDFRRKYGAKPVEYLIGLRVQEAERLLLETEMTIGAVGRAIGIDNTPYFIRIFKRKLGMTPGSYRAARRAAAAGPRPEQSEAGEEKEG